LQNGKPREKGLKETEQNTQSLGQLQKIGIPEEEEREKKKYLKQ
jgi:hypothetical protein